MYRRLYARYTPARLRLLREALGSLEVDAGLPIAWISLTLAQVHESRAEREDMEGIVEYPRRLKDVEVAILFREIGGGRTKASLRSNGDVDVADVARRLGGGGHVKAAGVVLEAPLDEARRRVLEPVRSAVRAVVLR
jgi:phosphoesterase RecJ-like protein